MSLENFNNFGGIKSMTNGSEESSSAGEIMEEGKLFKLKVEEYKDKDDSIEQLFNEGKDKSSLENFNGEAGEKVISRNEEASASVEESFSLPVKEIQDEVPVSEEKESNLDGITRGEKTRNENEKGGDKSCVSGYLEVLDDVEKEPFHFIDNNWR